MLDQFRNSLINLKLFDCEYDVMELYGIVSELPLLESLELDIGLTMKTSIKLTNEDLTKLMKLNGSKMETNSNMDNTNNSLNIVMKSSINGTFNMNDFKNSNQTSSKYLNFMKYLVNNARILTSEISTLNSNLLPLNYTTFWLFDSNNQKKNFFQSKCLDGLAGLAVNYTAEQKNMILEEIHRQLEQDRLQKQRLKEIENMINDSLINN